MLVTKYSIEGLIFTKVRVQSLDMGMRMCKAPNPILSDSWIDFHSLCSKS